MTDKITYKEPSQSQLELMQEFADVCSQAIAIIAKCEMNEALRHSSARIQEGMMWFHSYILNGGSIKAEIPSATSSEVSPTMAASRIVTIN